MWHNTTGMAKYPLIIYYVLVILIHVWGWDTFGSAFFLSLLFNILPIAVIASLSNFIFDSRITIDSSGVRMSTQASRKAIPWRDISDVHYRPGGYAKGITIPSVITLNAGENCGSIRLYSAMRNYEQLEMELSEKLQEKRGIDYSRIKETSSQLIVAPTLSMVGESLTYMAILAMFFSVFLIIFT